MTILHIFSVLSVDSEADDWTRVQPKEKLKLEIFNNSTSMTYRQKNCKNHLTFCQVFKIFDPLGVDVPHVGEYNQENNNLSIRTEITFHHILHIYRV